MGKVLDFEHRRKEAKVKALKSSLSAARKFGPQQQDPATKLKDIFRRRPSGSRGPKKP